MIKCVLYGLYGTARTAFRSRNCLFYFIIFYNVTMTLFKPPQLEYTFNYYVAVLVIVFLIHPFGLLIVD